MKIKFWQTPQQMCAGIRISSRVRVLPVIQISHFYYRILVAIIISNLFHFNTFLNFYKNKLLWSSPYILIINDGNLCPASYCLALTGCYIFWTGFTAGKLHHCFFFHSHLKQGITQGIKINIYFDLKNVNLNPLVRLNLFF